MKNKFKLVETEEYTLAVSDGVKAGDKSVLMVEGFTPMILTHFEPVEEGYEGKKIIAYKPKGNAPELNLPLLPDVEDDTVEKLAESYYTQIRLAERTAFKFGYKAATKKYSEFEMEHLYNLLTYDDLDDDEKIQAAIEYIQSLKQPKWFVAEIKHTKSEVFRENDNVPYAVLKTTTINNKIYLEGTYLN